ncbi:MAG: glycogen debranching enzyme N-terminal domain-containing protein [Verrucomicrobiales bacterium]|nr:glycogen debranching enzyme N-terminal domain-containing protein [Verrucomicrobiales bacterium]
MQARLTQTPAPGERQVRFVGDRLTFHLHHGQPPPPGWRARLRTNLGRAATLRAELITAVESRRPAPLSSWRDIPMQRVGDAWTLELPLAEVGFFKAKAYALDERGWQHWPDGPDFGVNVQPAWCRTANTIYCAFPRMFGPSKTARQTTPSPWDRPLRELDREGFTAIPPSGKLRDLGRELPHIFDTLGCRILHLLPVNPTPTTYARFGRFGSPYAGQDLLAIDPALVEFDKRTTGVDQFRELAYGVHARGGRLFLDMAVNHTGWGSTLLETHPEWFRRENGEFVSPGAWGTVWEDLVELDHRHAALRRTWGEVFVEWCRRGVDGFRCDAGYKVPVPVWQYVVARVRQEFPDTVFLLEGLGGAWEATEELLTEGGMQWAYSELFQNYTGAQVRWYLDYALAQSTQRGLYAHYSETHDNPRLAERGRTWSLLRNRLCALTSVSGAFGFTNGVEWLAPERVNVHSSRGLAWGHQPHLLRELGDLNRLLANHPCFHDGARLTRLSAPDSFVYALLRQSAEGQDAVLVLVNTDPDHTRSVSLDPAPLQQAGLHLEPDHEPPPVDLLDQSPPPRTRAANGHLTFKLRPAASYCLATTLQPAGPDGPTYRRRRALEAFALQALSQHLPLEQLGRVDLATLADQAERDPASLLSAIAELPPDLEPAAVPVRLRAGKLCERGRHEPDLEPAAVPVRLQAAHGQYPRVVTWQSSDRSRQLPVPPDHWLLVRDATPFRAVLCLAGDTRPLRAESTAVAGGHVAAFAPPPCPGDAELTLERYGEGDRHVRGSLRFLAPTPFGWPDSPPAHSLSSGGAGFQPAIQPLSCGAGFQPAIQPLSCGAGFQPARSPGPLPAPTSLVLLTNGRGGMARLGVDFGSIRSKYDCLLGANLHPSVPVDRHVFAKRARLWINADGFLSPLDAANLTRFQAGPPAVWVFVASAGDGRGAEIHVTAAMVADANTTVLRFHRPAAPPSQSRNLPDEADVRLTVRVDLEDRGYHQETKRNGGAEHHFATHTQPLPDRPGFRFTPAQDRHLRVWTTTGLYHPQPEWCDPIAHPVEASRGMEASGDAFSPGWFELPLPRDTTLELVLTAEKDDPTPDQLAAALNPSQPLPGLEGRRKNAECRRGIQPGRSGAPEQAQEEQAAAPGALDLAETLARAATAFLVRRDNLKTVIAGYPWFLDWGRDTLIVARGLLAAGWVEQVREILQTFGRFEQAGTLPNSLRGEDASNRETSDAPLWFGVVCEEWAALAAAPEQGQPGHLLQQTTVDPRGRSLADVLQSIAAGFIRGAPNGIRMDPTSALVFSPSHFTWMDTNHPAGTPREGYPVEIQALWIRLLRQLERLGLPAVSAPWQELAAQAEASLQKYFWLEHRGWYADVLLARPGQPAAAALAQDALRSNALFPISLGLVQGEPARRTVAAAQCWLVVPGALRSLAPLPVSPPLPIHGAHGRLLNDPTHPYWGQYTGDEDTRRKPAYHNGTGWTWPFPQFCEALARAWDFAPAAVAAARAYLGSIDQLLADGCHGHLPELVDGDAPHAQRGCDAQAWSVTEALRVWRLLETKVAVEPR